MCSEKGKYEEPSNPISSNPTRQMNKLVESELVELRTHWTTNLSNFELVEQL